MIIPCLWYDNEAEQAAKLYTSIFEDARLITSAHYNAESARASGQPEGSVMTVKFELAGQEFLGLNGGPIFKFTPALSFFVCCENEKEIDEKWAKLSEGGSVLMGLDKYPFAEKYGWCQDRFGLGWQLILAAKAQKIAPAFLFVGERFKKGEKAIALYTSLFPNSKIQVLEKDPATDSILHARFTLAGQEFVLMESGMKEHQFDFSHGMSFIVECTDQAELDHYWDKLSAGGTAENCGWLKDAFGVSWQIVPKALGEMMSQPELKKSEAVMKAMMPMKKLDIAALKKAFESAR